MTRPILSIGDLVADLIVSVPELPAVPGRHQVAQEIRLEPGGGANFLIAGARLGYPMAGLGALGDDDWGHQVAAMLRAEGIDLSGVRHHGTTTRVIVLVSDAGEHVFLGQYGHGPKITLTKADRTLIKNSGAVFCPGYTLCEDRLVDLTLEALAVARRNEVPIYFDPGPQVADVPPAIRQQVLAQVDTLLLTEAEVPLVSGLSDVTALSGLGPERVVLKRGGKGCSIWSLGPPEPKQVLDAPGYPVPVVDTAAAGDSFDAAFIVGQQWGWPPATCAKFANAVGAAKVQKLGGGRNVPSLADVRQIDAQFQLGLTL